MKWSKCPICEVPYDKHPGIAGTCANLKKAKAALELVRAWDIDHKIKDGFLVLPDHIRSEIQSVLEKKGGGG